MCFVVFSYSGSSLLPLALHFHFPSLTPRPSTPGTCLLLLLFFPIFFFRLASRLIAHNIVLLPPVPPRIPPYRYDSGLDDEQHRLRGCSALRLDPYRSNPADDAKATRWLAGPASLFFNQSQHGYVGVSAPLLLLRPSQPSPSGRPTLVGFRPPVPIDPALIRYR